MTTWFPAVTVQCRPGQAGGGEVGTNLGVAVAVVVVTNTPELQDRITTSIHTKLATLFN